MIRRIVVILAVLVGGGFLAVANLFGFLGTVGTAYAQDPSDYDVDARFISLYSSDVALGEQRWNLSSMETDEFYLLRLQRTSFDNPDQLVQPLASWGITGTATRELTIAYNELPRGSYPVRLVDNFGQTVWRGTVLPDPPAQEDWEYIGSNDPGLAIGPVVYNETNSQGHLHDSEAIEQVIVDEGDFIFFHFRLPNGTMPASFEDWYIELRNVETGTLAATFEAEELYAYLAPDTTQISSPNRYVPLNTAGTLLNWADNELADSVFTVGGNPITLTLDAGIYDYAIFDETDTQQETGESVLIVNDGPSDTPPWEASLDRETVSQGFSLDVIIEGHSETLWDAYPEQTVTDNEEGLIDPTDYDFASEIIVSFIVSDVIGDNAVSYTREANSLNFGQTVSEFEFVEILPYEIVEDRTLLEGILNMRDGLSTEWDIDSELASLLIYGLTNLVIFSILSVIAGILGMGGIPGVALVGTFAITGLTFLVIGMFGLLTSLIVGILIVVGFAVIIRRGGSDD